MDTKIFIPWNEYGIMEGYYKIYDLVILLRENKNNPDVIQFLTDMME